jgi:DNA-binding MarR family transcriptional regulator
MGGKLAKEIRQTKPFTSREEEAYLNLGRTFEFLQARVAGLLKQHHLTPVQYYMLRILRGAGVEGVTCTQACERMLSPDPDITRLLDRMEARKLLRRERSREDRRVVVSWIAPEGEALLAAIGQPLRDLFKAALGHIGQRRLGELIETLEALRKEAG